MEHFFLLNKKREYRYCFFQHDEQDFSNTFAVEFAMGADSYDQLYWGGRPKDWLIVANFSALVSSSDDNRDEEWQIIGEEIAYSNVESFKKIVQQASKKVESLKNMKDQM